MVDIIITAYHMHDYIDRAIMSIVMQRNTNDIRVTIVDDCDEEGYDYLIDRFAPFFGDRIEILRNKENRGCGQSRQTGIDHCTDKYFMFLDADDLLHSPIAVEELIKAAEGEQADIIASEFIEELDNGSYYVHTNDSTWMHGKLYRTSFIKYHDIRFNETRSNEDSAFNSIARTLCERYFYLNFCTYLWAFNPKSLTRCDDWTKNTAWEFVENSRYAVAELTRRNTNPKILLDLFVSRLLIIYGYYNQFLFKGTDEETMRKFLFECCLFWKEGHGDYYRQFKEFNQDISEFFWKTTVLEQMQRKNEILLCSIEDFITLIGGNQNGKSR